MSLSNPTCQELIDLPLHQTFDITVSGGNVNILRVQSGWVYTYDFRGYEKVQSVFVPAMQQEATK